MAVPFEFYRRRFQSTCKCGCCQLHECEEEGHCSQHPPFGVSGRVSGLGGVGRWHQSGFSAPNPTASSVICRCDGEDALGLLQ